MAGFGLSPSFKYHSCREKTAAQADPANTAQEVAKPDNAPRRSRKLGAHIAKNFSENWDNEYHYYGYYQYGDRHNDNRVDHCAFHFFLQLHIFFDIPRESQENSIKNTSCFSSCNKVYIQVVKEFFMFFQGIGKV